MALKNDKWLDRAAEYDRLLKTDAIAAEEYLQRFSKHIDRMIQAIAEFTLEKKEVERDATREHRKFLRGEYLKRMIGGTPELVEPE